MSATFYAIVDKDRETAIAFHLRPTEKTPLPELEGNRDLIEMPGAASFEAASEFIQSKEVEYKDGGFHRWVDRPEPAKPPTE